MQQCPTPSCGGQIIPDGERRGCLLCGAVASDRAQGMAERLVSTTILERAAAAQVGRPVAGPDMATLKARVLGAVRSEAADGHP